MPDKALFVVYDSSVEEFARKLCAEWNVVSKLAIKADEPHKTLASVEDICRWLLDCGADRDAVLVGIGGGVTTDLVGFSAGIYKRGISYINVPTTLLAQVDASIGGKCASNMDGVKNVLGVFHEPSDVLIYTEPLATLPVREWRSGAAELLKTFLVSDAAAYSKAVEVFSAGYSPICANEALTELITRAGSIKKSIVKEDPYDHGTRMVLNLGHTFGHAIEWWQSRPGCPLKEKFTHGEAVAIGTVQAARMSEAEGLAEAGLAERIAADFRACGLPTELPCPIEALRPAFKADKKSANDSIHFVYLCGIGRPVVKLRDISLI